MPLLKNSSFIKPLNLTVKQLKEIAKNKGVETQNFTYNSIVLDKQEKLKYYEYIFCLTFKINNFDCFVFYVKNESTDKEKFLTLTINKC